MPSECQTQVDVLVRAPQGRGPADGKQLLIGPDAYCVVSVLLM